MRHVAVGGADDNGKVDITGVVDGHLQSDAGGALTGRYRAVSRIARRNNYDDTGADHAIDFNADRALTACKPFRLDLVAEGDVDAS